MCDEAEILTAVQAHPAACAEFWWGKQLRAVQVDLRATSAPTLGELLGDAWEHKAPARTLRLRS